MKTNFYILVGMFALNQMSDSFADTTTAGGNATAPFSLVLDATTMSLKAGGQLSSTGYQIVKTWGYVGEQIKLAKETRYQLDIVASGTSGMNVWPRFFVMIDNVILNYWRLNGAAVQTYTGTFLIPAGNHKFQVFLLDGGSGRSTLVNRVTIGEVFPGTVPIITRGPLIQNPDGLSTTVQLDWWTDQVTDGTVEYGLTESLGNTVTAGTRDYHHKVKLVGLSPDTRYFYRFISNGHVVESGHTFRTLASPGSAAPVSFAIIGDFGSSSGAEREIARLIDLANLPMVITLGDNVYPFGSQLAYDFHWLRPYQGVNAKAMVFPTWGNHDEEISAKRIFTPPGNGSYYSFDAGDVHFTMLDSNQKRSAVQKAWLEADLATTQRKWKLVFMHNAPYSCGTLAGNDLYVRSNWAPIFEKYKVDVVFAGHEHTYTRTKPIDDFNVNGAPGPDGLSTIYVVEGASGGGGHLSNTCPSIVAKSGGGSYVAVVVNGGALRVNAINQKGLLIDTMTLTQSQPAPPTVTLTTPANGATISGTNIVLSAIAVDKLGVEKVEFYLDNRLLTTINTAPYRVNWNPATVPAGKHTLSAKAYGISGQFSPSKIATVNVTKR